MVVRSRTNPYLGVNAHLHSLWQAQGGWHEFHSLYLANLYTQIKPLLLDMGYTAALESSIQVRRIDDFSHTTDRPESDIALYDPDRYRATQPRSGALPIAEGELVLTLDAVLEAPVSEKAYDAIRIYDLRARQGSPVGWVELLSPSNKPRSSDWRQYNSKRQQIIENKIVFIEIDYLHETSSTIPVLPPYLFRGEFSPDYAPHAYHLLVIDLRMNDAPVRVRGFDVDERIPSMRVALNGSDQLTFDFDTPYHKAIHDGLFGLELVDYAQVPLHFDRYSPEDQARIEARMRKIVMSNER
jgi:hypothetical protein